MTEGSTISHHKGLSEKFKYLFSVLFWLLCFVPLLVSYRYYFSLIYVLSRANNLNDEVVIEFETRSVSAKSKFPRHAMTGGGKNPVLGDNLFFFRGFFLKDFMFIIQQTLPLGQGLFDQP